MIFYIWYAYFSSIYHIMHISYLHINILKMIKSHVLAYFDIHIYAYLWVTVTTNSGRTGWILRHWIVIFTPVMVVPVCKCRSHYQRPSCERRRRLKHDEPGLRLRQQQSTRTLTPLRPPAVSVTQRPPLSLRLLPLILCTSEAPSLAAARRGEHWRGSSAKWTDAGRLRIIKTTRRNSGSASTWSTRGMRKPGSRALCAAAAVVLSESTVTVQQPCPRQDRLPLGCSEAQEGDWSGEREEETASDSERSWASVEPERQQQQFEYLLNQVAMERKNSLHNRLGIERFLRLSSPTTLEWSVP